MNHNKNYLRNVPIFRRTVRIEELPPRKLTKAQQTWVSEWPRKVFDAALARTIRHPLADAIERRIVEVAMPQGLSLEPVHDLAGCLPDVCAFLAGIPECMLAPKPKPSANLPTVRLGVSLTVDRYITAETAARRAADIMAGILSCRETVNCEVVFFSACTSDDSMMRLCFELPPLTADDWKDVQTLAILADTRTLRDCLNGEMIRICQDHGLPAARLPMDRFAAPDGCDHLFGPLIEGWADTPADIARIIAQCAEKKAMEACHV